MKRRGRDESLRANDEDANDRLNEALARGFESIKAGRFRTASDVIADLRRRTNTRGQRQ